MSDKVSVDEIKASWLKPAAVVELVMAHQDQSWAMAVWAIVGRLRSGLIRVAAHDAKRTWSIIPTTHWESLGDHFASHAFWKSGDVKLVSNWTSYQTQHVEYFSARLDPAGVSEWLGEDPKAAHPSEPPPATASERQETKSKADETPELGPQVGPGLLKAWFDLYAKAFTGSANTEANALKSARGMFHRNSVSRDSVRALLGSRSRGRRPNDPT